MRAYLLIGFAFFTFTSPAFSQSANKFIVQEYNSENGLPANGIKGIAYDKATNFLWIATEAGILRFNGQDFKVFTTRNLPQLSSERIAILAANKKGEIVFLDTKINTFRIEKNKPVLLKKHDAISTINYNSILSFKLSNPILSRKMELIEAKSQPNIYNTIVEVNDTACVFTNNDNAILYYSVFKTKADTIRKKQRFVPYLFETDNQIFCKDENGNVFKLNTKLKTLESISLKYQQKEITSEQIKKGALIWENNNQKTLLFLNKDAYYLSFDGKNLIANLICNVIPTSSNIRYALYDADTKHLFIGTQSKGILIIKPNYFKNLKNPVYDPLIPNATYTQIELGDRQVLTNYGIISGEGNKPNVKIPIKKYFGLSSYSFKDSIMLFSARHPITNNNVIHSYNFKTGETIGYAKIPINSTFGAALSNQKVFLATRDGFGILQGDSLKVIVPPPSGAQEGISPIDMKELSPGVFLTTSCDGLITFNSHTKKADTLMYLPGNCFRAIQKIGDYFFIGTYGAGFFLYKDGVIKQMPLDKEKYLLYAHCFMPVSNGFCWISTNRGLLKAKISDIISSFTENNSTIYYHYFGKNDGIEMTELNGGCTPCAIQLKDRTLSFPTMDGLLWVHPDTIQDINPGSELYIDELIADGKSISENPDNIILPPMTNSITINLSYYGWGNRENIYLDYRLGKDGLWKPVKIEEGAIIQLDNLPAGKYELTIRKLNGFGKNNFTYKTIAFSIEKPWFNRWWFYLLCLLTALFLIRLYLNYTTRILQARRLALEKQVAEKTKELLEQNAALEKSNSVQTRLISIISHDIITPLKFMAVGGKELIEKHDVMPESLRQETIEEITHTAQELQLLSTNIMNWMKYQNENRKQIKETFNIFELTNQVTGVLKPIAKQKNIPIINTIPAELTIFQYYEPLKILLYNLLSNAINFSITGEIKITANPLVNNLTLTVEDEGVGMTNDQIKNILSDEFIISSANIDNRKGNGLGYLIIKDLLKMIEGKISIESKKGKGTIITVTFPSIIENTNSKEP
jgi:signal transduction histidine kinase